MIETIDYLLLVSNASADITAQRIVLRDGSINFSKDRAVFMANSSDQSAILPKKLLESVLLLMNGIMNV
jgi:hypothetical protein